MSQEVVRRLLLEESGETTVESLMKNAEERYPGGAIDAFLESHFEIMVEKGIVEQTETGWRITEEGRSTDIKYGIWELDAVVSEEELETTYGLTVANIVGSLRLDIELDLDSLSEDLKNTDYHPETYPSLIYRSNVAENVSVLTPSSGKLAIVGAKTKNELTTGVEDFLENLDALGIDVSKELEDILVQNVVANFDVEQKIDLSTVSLVLGLENIEYEPEQFPGLIYRGSGNSTVLLFNSGKCVITGVKSYLELVEAQKEVVDLLLKSTIDLDQFEDEYNRHINPPRESDKST